MIEANGVRTAAAAARGPSMGQFVSLRGRLWLVEEQPETPFDGHRLACVDDDASGEDAQVLWSAEVDARLRDEEAWASLASGGGDAETFSAYLRTVRWRTATAAERDLFQAPFRAGIRLDPYQLLPLRKALRLPRVNLLIADDVGLGKTVEAGLVLREMLLRRRVDYMVVLAPAAMTGQWRDELQTKFGLSFEIIDRQHLESLRRRRGYGANPWATGSRFILSHRLLGDEAYVAGLRDVLEEFRARSLLILDEAHHAAPAGGGRYAVESQFTRSLRDLSDRFEHRLFLSATPHNGHPNSFATLLELLDPQRFTRGVPVRPADLEPVMVRRLKSDLRALGEAFPERVVEPVVIDGLDRHAPELRLAAMLADYRALRERRIGTLGAAQGARARLAFVGLQQRLLSSVPAFARTLRVHLAGLERLIAGETAQPAVADEDPDAPERADEEDAAFERLDRAEAALTEAAAMAIGGAAAQLLAERDHAAAMLVVADAAKTAPDARVRWIIDWARANLLDAEGRWRDRRLILFTEYEDTRRWLQRQLSVLLDPADADEVARIDSFTGVTSTERREAIKRAFNDPASPLRILLCTDAAREGINLQAQCHDLIHVDLPWNPSRLEQRNGRIDRKLQPSDTVTCRYFVYAQRPEDVVLDALVRKTEAIRRQLGSAGEVLGDRIADRLGRGIDRAAAQDLAERIRDEEADERVRAAVRDLDDGEEARRARLMREQADLAAMLDKARARVGVDPDELQSVVGLALARAGGGWGATGAVGDTPVFALDQAAPAFAGDPSWQPMLDELRARGPKPGERPGEWRASADAGVRRVSFAPAILPDGRDAGDVVQLHLEHRLVRRLLGRFLSAGFQQGLDRACVIETPATPAPRVVLIGRLALYGERAARLHEEVLSVAADWRDRERDGAALRPLAEGRDAEARVLDQLIAALAGARTAGAEVAQRATAHAGADVDDLRGVLEMRAAARGQRVAAELEKRAASEAAGLETLLGQRIARIRRERGEDDRQFALLLDPAEARQRAADRRSWERAATRLDDELVREPERLRAAARVRATRLEPIGLVYLWPAA